MLTGGDPARKSAILGAAANFAGSAVPYNRDFPDDHAQVVVQQREWVGVALSGVSVSHNALFTNRGPNPVAAARSDPVARREGVRRSF